ncbi:hypothetical protein LVJ94_39185 [Pendulispora rubella]|uniref:DUF3558 domain-containing protein n=1 Tax=Pendulispora rubella TaxID=2741070 RepID=A0ABZ2KW52_9BACT
MTPFKALSLLCLITSVGCAGAEELPAGDDTGEAQSAVLAVDSKFTSIKPESCTKIDEGPAYAKYDCGGLAGYRLLTEDDDLRANVRVGRGSAEMDLNVWSGKIGGGAFTFLGDTVDWRGVVNGAAFDPFAITFRVTSQNVQYLVVAKVGATKSCQFKVINASKHPDASALARQAADASRTAACPATIPTPE